MRKLGLVILLFFGSQLALAQTPRLEVFGGYSFLHSPGQNFNGWNGSATVNVYRCLGITADFSGHYWSQSFTVPGFGSFTDKTHVFSYTFGPTLALRNKSRFTPFGRFLVGGSRYSFPPTRPTISISPMNQLTVITGGGLDVTVNSLIAIRPVQLDYHGVDFSGFWTNSVRYSAGVVFRFGERK